MPALRGRDQYPTTPSPRSTSTDASSDQTSSPSSGKPKRARARRVKNHNHIPRPRNAFIIFRSHYIHFLKSKANNADEPAQQDVISTSAEFQQNELSKIAAKVWNSMDAEDRKPYAEEARIEKEWHKKMYPDYVYRAPSAGGEKMKRFKIKVNTGDPSKDQDRSSLSALSSPGQQEPDHSSAFFESPLAPSDIDIEIVRIPSQWPHENQPQHHDQQYPLQSIGTEHTFVPTECIPPLELYPPNTIEQECREEVDVKLTVMNFSLFQSPCPEIIF